jgi:hypothetical protein
MNRNVWITHILFLRLAVPIAGAPGPQLPSANRAHIVQAYGRLPMSFEANEGQTDPRVKFLSRGSGYTLFLTGNEAVLALRSRESGATSQNGKGPWSLVGDQLHKAKTKEHGLWAAGGLVE